MPRQRTPVAAPVAEPEPLHDVVTVEKPTVGRIVLVNVGGMGEAVLRPAIVVDAKPLGLKGDVTVQVFLSTFDHPVAPGLRLRQEPVGTSQSPKLSGWTIESCPYGLLPGQWQWPTRTDPETFEP